MNRYMFMPFCPNCGRDVEEGMNFCPSCRHQLNSDIRAPSAEYTQTQTKKTLPVTPWGSRVTSEKSGVVAIVLSLILPGIGTVYAGNVAKGLILLVAMIFLPLILLVVMTMGVAILVEEAGGIAFFAGIAITAIATLVLYIYCIYDAYHHCEISNELWYRYNDY